MCYPKPGPRCSAEAAVAISKIDQQMREMRDNAPVSTFENFNEEREKRKALEAKKQAAQLDYDMTPAGMLELARRLGQDRKGNKSEYALRLAAAKASRTTALAAIGVEDAGDVAHNVKRTPRTYTTFPHDFVQDGEVRMALINRDAAESATASQKWLGHLTADEIEAMAWLTSNGSVFLNTYLDTGEVPRGLDNRKLTQAQINKYISDGKSAIAKHQSKPVMIYRGESYLPGFDKLWNSQDDPAQMAKAQALIEAKFPVGGIYEPNRFLSSSYDPGIAADFSGNDVILEIKSKTHGPVAAISAWGNREREAIIAPGTKYRVVGIKPSVTYQAGRAGARSSDEPRQENKLVVQLEEI